MSKFKDIYNLVDDFSSKSNINELKIIMQLDETKDKIKDLLDSNYDISMDDINDLGYILKAANIIYSDSGDDTGLTDSEYDALISLYEDITKKELPIGAPLLSSSDKVSAKYLTLRGTLAKIYKLTDDDILTNKSQKTIDDWITKIKNIYKENTGKNLDTEKLNVMVVPKYDGVSVVCEFTKDGNLIRALTRGDTDNNKSKDITNVIKYVMPVGPFTNAKSEYAVKCEAMTLNSDLNEVNEILHKDYKNTRALAAGILNTDDIDKDLAKYLHLIQLRYSYFENGKESEQFMSADMYNYYYTTIFTKDSYSDIRDWALKHGNVNPGYRCDGAVICIMDEDVREALGRSNDKQNYEVAFKFTMEYAMSEVKDVIFQVGNLGKVTPVVEFKKVKLKGNDVKRATISYQDFLKYRLSKGDEIKVIYDIIPSITVDNTMKKSGKKMIKPPKVCPECGATLLVSETGKKLQCENPNCVCRIKGKILNYVIKMGIENISYETISDFYDLGFLNTIDDLYKLESKAKKISEVPGYGIVSISKIIKSIDDNKVVTPSKFLGSLGIEGISNKKFHDLFQHISYEEVLDAGYNKEIDALIGIPGIQEKSSNKIINGIYENRKLIEKLDDYLTVIDEPMDNKSLFSVTFTKIRDDELENYIKSIGGTVDNTSVTSTTSLVIVPTEGIESSKTKKAEKYGIPIVPIKDAKKYINEVMKFG